jgi:hypothetical protein
MGARLWIALASIVLLVPTQRAYACSCMSTGPACQAYWKTDAVFDGTVRSVRALDRAQVLAAGPTSPIHDRIVRLDVSQGWKGVQPGPIEVATNSEESACGFQFKEGERYLVFARYSPADGRLVASRCSLTQAFNGTGPAAEFLASLSAPPRGGRVFGNVRTFLREVNSGRSTETRTETLVRLLGAGQERTTTSSGGRYEFTNLSPGSYSIELQVPAGHRTYSPTRRVEISDPRGCAEEDYSLSPAGRITGRLVGKDNRGLPRVRVEFAEPNARVHPVYGLSTPSTTTNADGDFEIEGLSPGRYIVGVNLTDLVNEYNPYARAVFPGHGSEPVVVTLSLGEAVDLGIWELPPPVPVVKAAGVVAWQDGSPAAGVYVSASDRTGNPVERGRGVGGATSGPDGRFVIELRQGRVYTFTARDKQFALPIALTRIQIGTASPPPIRLVIQQDRPRQ